MTTVLFVVVDGIPSIGSPVLVGSGQMGTQQVLDVQVLPSSSVAQAQTSSSTSSSATPTSGNEDQASSAESWRLGWMPTQWQWSIWLCVVGVWYSAMTI